MLALNLSTTRMNALKCISHRACITRKGCVYEFVLRLQSTTGANAATDVKIDIPPRIERGPTDILRAISDATPRDPTRYHYKYWDDPAFRPDKVYNKANFALARESGRKTAEWVHKTHYDMFQKTDDDPKVLAFTIPPDPTCKEETSEEMLMASISQGDVETAMKIYTLLEENVSVKTKVSLFELLCYYNGKPPLEDEKYPEYRYFLLQDRKRDVRIWEDLPEIGKLFDFLKQQDQATVTAAYNIIICGTAKHGNPTKAVEFYNECTEKEIPLTIESYNMLLYNTRRITQSWADREQLFTRIINDVFKANVLPNVKTLNSTLAGVVSLYFRRRPYCLMQQIIKCYRGIGIEPSLASYMYLFKSLPDTGPELAPSCAEILKDVVGRRFEYQDADDVRFFQIAMLIVANNLRSVAFAKMLYQILCSHDNKRFLTRSEHETSFYSNFLQLLVDRAPLEEFYEIYMELVPHIFIPVGGRFYEACFERLQKEKLETVLKYVPKVVNDYASFALFDVDRLNKIIKQIALWTSLDHNSSNRKKYAEDCWTLHNKVRESSHNCKYLLDLTIIQLYAGESERALQLILHLQAATERQRIIPDKVQQIFDLCMSQKLLTHMIAFIEYLMVNDYGSIQHHVEDIVTKIPPDCPERKRIIELVGVTNTVE